MKLLANKENKENRINSFLKAISDPKIWPRSDGRYTEVITPNTLKAKELMEVYMLLKNNSPINERLDILLLLKHIMV